MPTRTQGQRLVALGLRWAFRAVMVMRVWGRVRVAGRRHIPRRGAVLVVSNHLGAGDPEILWAIFPRQLWFLALDTLFDIRGLGFLMRCAGAIPLRRDYPDRHALGTSLELLRRGEPVAIYPEGERTMRADLERPHGGVGFLALRSGALILPVGMAGSERVYPRMPMVARQRGIDVVVGKPFHLPAGMTDRREASEYIHRRVAELIPWQYRGYLREDARL